MGVTRGATSGGRSGAPAAACARALSLGVMRILAIVAFSAVAFSGPQRAWSDSSESLASRLAALRCARPAGNYGGNGPERAARLFASYGEYARAYQALAESSAESASFEDDDLRARLLIALGRYDAADSALALRPHERDRRRFYLHHLRRARVNALAGRADRALSLLRRLDGASLREFDPYRDLLVVEVLLRCGRPDDALDVAERRFAAGFPRSLTPSFESRMLDCYLAALRPADALVLLDTLESRKGQKSALAPVLAREVDVRFEMGDTIGAVGAALDFVESHGAGRSLAPVDAAVSRGNPSRLEDAALLDFADVFIAHKRAAEAEALLRVVEGRVLNRTDAERTRLYRSEISYQSGRQAEAGREASAPFADPALERRAKILRARAYRGTGEKTRAAEAYAAFARAYPYDPKAPEALYVAWDLYREEKNPAAAGILGAIVATYPDNRYARIATRRIALENIERRRYDEAERVLQDALRRWGRQDESLLYYLATVYGRQGRKAEERKTIAEIAAVDSFSFYLDPGVDREFVLPGMGSEGGGGGSADGDLGDFLECVGESRASARDSLAGAVDPWPLGGCCDGAEDYLERGLVFLEMGFRDWAETELRFFESWKGLPPRALLSLSALYDEHGLASRSVRAVQRVRDSLSGSDRRRLDRCLRPLSFPVPFPVAVMEGCGRFGMAPHLVYAMMREESLFDERAVSGAGARGLMQLMPRTAEELAGKLGFPEDSARDFFAPELNVTVGVFYASELLAEAKGNPWMMLAGYNAGFSNARRWFGGAAQGESIAERVDSIDYWETCDYVKKIVESARVYHGLYFSSSETAICK